MKKREGTEAAIWLVMSLSVLLTSYKLGIGQLNNPGPGFIPAMGALGLGLFSLVFLLFRFLDRADNTPAEPLWKGMSWLYPSLTVVVLSLYCVLLPVMGYLLATPIMMAVFLTMGRLKIHWGILTAVIATAATYILFKVCLSMSLPQGILGY